MATNLEEGIQTGVPVEDDPDGIFTGVPITTARRRRTPDNSEEEYEILDRMEGREPRGGENGYELTDVCDCEHCLPGLAVILFLCFVCLCCGHW